MRNVANTNYPVLWQLKNISNPLPFHPQSLFLNEWGRNFEFEFCKNIEDKLNGVLPRVTQSVVLHAYIRRSQILLTFSRHQMRYIYRVFHIELCLEVA